MAVNSRRGGGGGLCAGGCTQPLALPHSPQHHKLISAGQSTNY